MARGDLLASLNSCIAANRLATVSHLTVVSICKSKRESRPRPDYGPRWTVGLAVSRGVSMQAVCSICISLMARYSRPVKAVRRPCNCRLLQLTIAGQAREQCGVLEEGGTVAVKQPITTLVTVSNPGGLVFRSRLFGDCRGTHALEADAPSLS